MSLKNQHGSFNNNDVETPTDLYVTLDHLYQFDHDPCPFQWDPKSQVPDGLKSEWGQSNWVNPPYRGIKKWARKAHEEHAKGKKTLMLIPYRPHTKYWKRYVWPTICDMKLLDDQIQFTGYKTKLPINLVLIEYNPSKAPKFTNHRLTDSLGYYAETPVTACP